jgi:hypothetical protein
MAVDYSSIEKIDIIIGAYSQMRISGITVNPTPEDLQLALERLEDMAAEFETRNMSAGYMLEEIPDPQSPVGVPRGFKYAYETGLAVRLIPDFNKQVPQTLLSMANSALSNMAARTALQRETPYPNRMPRGSGNTLRFYRWDRFYREYGLDPATTKQMRVGDINEYFEEFADYLKDLEEISSFVVEPDKNIEITAESQDNTRILYTVSAPENNATSARYVDIQITTTLGRVEKRRAYFNITE